MCENTALRNDDEVALRFFTNAQNDTGCHPRESGNPDTVHSHENGNPGEKMIWIPNQVGDDILPSGSPIKDFGDDSCVDFGDDSCVDFGDDKSKKRRFFVKSAKKAPSKCTKNTDQPIDRFENEKRTNPKNLYLKK